MNRKSIISYGMLPFGFYANNPWRVHMLCGFILGFKISKYIYTHIQYVFLSSNLDGNMVLW